MPECPLRQQFEVPEGKLEILLEQDARVLLRYAPDEMTPMPRPQVATEPPLPERVESSDELYLIGVHLEQYRHPTRHPETYWREAIRRDPQDSRANAALGLWHLRRGEFTLTETHLCIAIQRMTKRNPKPSDGEPCYNQGLMLGYLDRQEESYAAFYKATWSAAWKAAAYHRLAEIDCARQDWHIALEHLDRSSAAMPITSTH